MKKTIDEIMKEQDRNSNEENVKVKVQVLKDDKVINETEGRAIIGIIMDDCDCGNCDGTKYAKLIIGKLNKQNLIIGKYKFDKFIDDKIEAHGNPLVGILEALSGIEE